MYLNISKFVRLFENKFNLIKHIYLKPILTMKKISASILICMLFVGSIFQSCGKYEEGPSISFIPKAVRLQQQWKEVETIDLSNNISQSPDNGEYVEFREGGIYRASTPTGSLLNLAGVNEVVGTWAFSEDKTQLFINCVYNDPILGLEFSNNIPDDTCKIIRLKQNDLGLEDQPGNKYYYVHQ